LNQGSATIPSQTYHDLTAQYRFDSSFGLALLSNTEIQLGIRNVFNKTPPLDTSAIGFYYSKLGDPRLANYYLSLKKSF
jgi:iron complex outermembrane recepter protein